jgi:hypothetical protein
VFSLGRTPRRDLTPSQNARAFGSLSGVGGKPYPTVFPWVRAPHLPTPGAATSCLPPRALATSPCAAPSALSSSSSSLLPLPIQATSISVAAPPHPGAARPSPLGPLPPAAPPLGSLPLSAPPLGPLPPSTPSLRPLLPLGPLPPQDPPRLPWCLDVSSQIS